MKITASLPPVAGSAAEARQLVGRALTDWRLPDARETALTLVTELVSNGVRHAHTPLTLQLSFDGSSLHLAVTDEDHTQPVVGTPSLRSHHGWGLHLVGSLSSNWGTTLSANGKTVWCDVDVSHQHPFEGSANPITR